MLYDFSLIYNESNWVRWILVLNYWSEGILLTGICLAIALVILAVARYADAPLPEAAIVSSFFGFLISSLLWLLKYNGIHSVPTLIPVLFLFILGFAVVAQRMQLTTE